MNQRQHRGPPGTWGWRLDRILKPQALVTEVEQGSPEQIQGSRHHQYKGRRAMMKCISASDPCVSTAVPAPPCMHHFIPVTAVTHPILGMRTQRLSLGWVGSGSSV